MPLWQKSSFFGERVQREAGKERNAGEHCVRRKQNGEGRAEGKEKCTIVRQALKFEITGLQGWGIGAVRAV